MLVGSDGHVDTLSMVGVCLCVVSVMLFHFVVRAHFRTYVDYQLQILSLRVAMIIPIYSIVTVLMLIQPKYHHYFEAVAVMCEAYSIYCYFALIVMYCGGKERVYELIRSSHHTKPCWASCQQGSPKQCFQTINILLLQFIFVRPIFVLLQGVVEDHDLSDLFRFLGVISLIVGMMGLLRAYHVLAEHAREMDATTKIVFIKIMIIFLAIEDLVLNSIYASGALDGVKGFGNYSDEERAVRFYAIIVLAEFMFASILTIKYFHPGRIGAGDHDLESQDDYTSMETTKPHGANTGKEIDDLSYAQFIKDLLRVIYVFSPPPGFGKLSKSPMACDANQSNPSSGSFSL